MSSDQMGADVGAQVALAAMQEADVPPDVASMIGAVISTMDPSTLSMLLTDAMLARAMLEDGERAGAAEIIGRYREWAESAGLGPIFDEMFGDI